MTVPSATADFDEFYRRSAARVIHLVYATTGDLGLAQDCAQEAYARAWQQWARLREYDEPSAWVRTVARRLAISQWRSRERERAAFVRSHEGPVVASPADAVLDSVSVRAALATLSLEQREVLALFYVCDLPIARIARELDTPVGTIKARLSRGRTALATCLDAARTGKEPRP